MDDDLEQAAQEKRLLGAGASFERPRHDEEADFCEYNIADDDPYGSHVPESTSSHIHTILTPLLSVIRLSCALAISPINKCLPSDTISSLRSDSYPTHASRIFWMLLSSLGGLAFFCLPSFVQSRLIPASERRPAKVHATSWLDGLRGLAALFVFVYHYSQRIWQTNDYTWGGHEGDHVMTGFFRLPIVRILYAGPAAVSMFFVVSGFALSIRPVSQMRKLDRAGVMSTVSSATLRRPLRLFLPCLAATFLDFLAVRAGLFDLTRDMSFDRNIIPGQRVPHAKRIGTFWYQLGDWASKGFQMIDPFDFANDRYNSFTDDWDKHLWTIPIEFRCSLVLFLTQIALANCSSVYRVLIQTLLTLWTFTQGRWDMMLFWGGGLLCELHQMLQSRRLSLTEEHASSIPTSSETKWSSPSSRLPARHPHSRWLSLLRTHATTISLTLSLLAGLFFLSYPRLSGASTPGFVWITSLLPTHWGEWYKYHFWHGVGSLQVVATVACFPVVARALSSSVPRYLGQISFSLYLVHGVVNHTVGYALLGATYAMFGGGTPWRDATRFGVSLLIDTAVVVWVADMFWRGVDGNTVRFARWAEGKIRAA